MKISAKRVLIFSTAYLPFVGGAEVAVKEITDRLSSDFSFVLITARLKPDLPEYEKIGAVEVHRIGQGDAWDKYRLILSGYKKALEDIIISKPKVIHAYADLSGKKKPLHRYYRD